MPLPDPIPDDYYVVRGCTNHGIVFKYDEIENDKLTDASVNCGNTVKIALRGLPAHFNHYSSTTVRQIKYKKGKIKNSPDPPNMNHCTLYNILISDAKSLFSEIIQRQY